MIKNRSRLRTGIRVWDRIHRLTGESPQYNDYNPDILKAREWLEHDAKPDQKVLDVGSGTGKITSGIKVGEVVSLEPTWIVNRPHKFSHKVPSRSVIGIGQELPFRDNSFDKILISYALEYIPERAEATREIRRVLKPKGKLIVLLHKQRSIYLKAIRDFVSGRTIFNYFLKNIRNRKYKEPSDMVEDARTMHMSKGIARSTVLSYVESAKSKFHNQKGELDREIRENEESIKHFQRLIDTIGKLFPTKQKVQRYFNARGFRTERIEIPRGKRGDYGFAVLLENTKRGKP